RRVACGPVVTGAVAGQRGRPRRVRPSRLGPLRYRSGRRAVPAGIRGLEDAHRPARACLEPRAVGADRPRGAGAVKLSVVIPTYQRPALLRRLLMQLAAQTAAQQFDVHVVDDGSERPAEDALADLPLPIA